MQHVALSDFLGTPTSTDFDHHDIYIYITMLVGNFLHDFIASWGLPSTMSRWIKRASFKHSQPYPATTPKVVNTNKLCTRLVSQNQIGKFGHSSYQKISQCIRLTPKLIFGSTSTAPRLGLIRVLRGLQKVPCLVHALTRLRSHGWEIWQSDTKCYWEVGKRLFYTSQLQLIS